MVRTAAYPLPEASRISGGPGAENHRGGTSRLASLEAPPARAPANSAANVEAGSSLRFFLSLSARRLPNARLQPPAARNARIELDARIQSAPTVGCEPWLGDRVAPSIEPKAEERCLNQLDHMVRLDPTLHLNLLDRWLVLRLR